MIYRLHDLGILDHEAYSFTGCLAFVLVCERGACLI